MSRDSIVATLSFFSLFRHPLTASELYWSAWKPDADETAADFFSVLSSLSEEVVVAQKNGFFFLSGNEDFALNRAESFFVNSGKNEWAKKAIKVFAWLPFVRAVFVCNTVAMGVAKKDSDIDLLVVSERGRVWLARLLMNIFLKTLGWRTSKNRIADRFCLSFFIDEDYRDFSVLALSGGDPYLVYWLLNLRPIHDPDDFLPKLLKANSWLKEFCPRLFLDGGGFIISPGKDSYSKKISRFLSWFFKGKIGDKIESFFYYWQKKNLAKRVGAGDGSAIVLEKNIIKIHEKDMRQIYKDKFFSICKNK